MAKSKVYKALGFTLLSMLEAGGLVVHKAAVVSILKGQALHDDGTGYATNTVTAFANTFLGIATEDVDNTAALENGDAAVKGSRDIFIISPLNHYQFMVPVGSTAVLIAQTDVKEKINLEAAGTVDPGDAVSAGTWGFIVDEIDVSAEAVAANTYGYAIGHFDHY